MTLHHVVKLLINLLVFLLSIGGEDVGGVTIGAIAASVLLFVQSLYDVRVGSALVGFIILSVLQEDFVHVGAGILEQLIGAVKDDEGDFTVTQDTQLIGLLHQTKLPLHESHLTVPLIYNPGDLDLLPPHFQNDFLPTVVEEYQQSPDSQELN